MTMVRPTTYSTTPPSPGTVLGGAGLPTDAHLAALRTRGPDALSGERTFNDCGGRAHARTAQSTGGLRIDTAGNQSCPQSPSLAVGPLHPSTSVPGAGLPEFRALLILVSWPLAVIGFVAAILWIFQP